MRLIKNYSFRIKTKIPYAVWPTLVHQFLDEQHLTSRSFFYYFDDYPKVGETLEKQIKMSACGKILRDTPYLGECRFYNGKRYGRDDFLFLSNIDGDPMDSDAVILPLMQKIHRRYGFAESNLYYWDIDFFGKNTSFERKRLDGDDPSDPAFRPYGSGICLHRDVCGENELLLSVDILHDGMMMDPEPYADAMKRLLPGIKVEDNLKICLTDEEKRDLERLHITAAPALERCSGYLDERLNFSDVQNYFEGQYSIAAPLKKLAKKYGYTYRNLYRNCIFSLQKRTEKGKILYIDIDSGPSHDHLGLSVLFCGIGYTHDLGGAYAVPRDQTEADLFLERSMEILTAFEKEILPILDREYPATPDWFTIEERP